MRWALLLALLSTSALASRADRLSVSPRLDRRDRLGAAASAPSPILLSLSLLPPDSECSGTPPDGVTFTRASDATCIDSSGVAHALTTDEARVHGTLGLLVEGSATNAVLHSRDVTAASWANTGCLKTAAGMDGVLLVGRCTGSALVSQTLTVATGTRTASAYVRRQSGACTLTLSADSESTGKALTGGWERLVLTYTSDGSVTLDVSVGSGCVADIDYVQDEAGSIATSPIVTAGTAAVRAADAATIPEDIGLNPSELCSSLDVAPLWTGGHGNATSNGYLTAGASAQRLGYSNPGLGDVSWTAYAGQGNTASVEAGWTAGVPKRYRTELSVSQDRLQVFNVSDGTSGTAVSTIGFQSVVSPIGLGVQGATTRANAHLSNLVLGRTPEACQ